MTSVEEIVNIIFGGKVNVADICSIIVAIWGVVMSIVTWRAKVNAIRKDNAMLSKDKQIEAQRQELDELKKAISGLSSLITDAYLSNANVSADTKKVLASQAEKIAKIADLDLSAEAEKLIEKAQEYAPDSDLVKHAEDVKAEVAASEEVLDTVSEEAQTALAKLNV